MSSNDLDSIPSPQRYRHLLEQLTEVIPDPSSPESQTSYIGIRARGYYRVSNDDPVDEETEIRQICTTLRWTLVNLYVDVAGQDSKLQEMLYEVQTGESIIVYQINRLGSSFGQIISTVLKLRERGVHLYIAKEKIDTRTPSGKAMYLTLASLEGIDLDLQSEKGKRLRSRTPFGKQFIRSDLPFADHPGDLACVEEMRALLGTPNGYWWTPTRLTRWLNGQNDKGESVDTYTKFYRLTRTNDAESRQKRVQKGLDEWLMFTPSRVTQIIKLYGLTPTRRLLIAVQD